MNILRYVSDLHLEIRNTHLHPKLFPLWNFKSGPNDTYNLALLGDIGNPYHESLSNFLGQISPKYSKIFYVPGNHEYHNYKVEPNRSVDEFKTKLKQICDGFPNIVLMDNATYDLNNIKIIGTTLWSNIPNAYAEKIEPFLNDYHMIIKNKNNENNKITVDDTNKWNVEALKFIEQEIKTDKPCIVLTHHAPLSCDEYATADPKYSFKMTNYAFHNNLLHLFDFPIRAWLYGHTHYASSFKVNDIVVATNQLGYASEENNIRFNSYAYLNLNLIAQK